MAMKSSDSYGGGSLSYAPRVVARSYTLKQALAAVETGELSPKEVYSQMPGALKEEVDRLANEKYSRAFPQLDFAGQRGVMALLKKGCEEAERPMTLLEALTLASEGRIDDLAVFGALPEQIQQMLDSAAEQGFGKKYESSDVEHRRAVLRRCLEASDERKGETESDARQSTPKKRRSGFLSRWFGK